MVDSVTSPQWLEDHGTQKWHHFAYAIGSFLDHDRPYIAAKNPIAADSALAAFVRSQLADFVHLDKETMAEGLERGPRTSPSVRLWIHPD